MHYEQKIQAAVCRYYGCTPEELRAHSRSNQQIVRARKVFFSLLKRKLSWSLSEIGRFVDRDHTSILHALKQAVPIEEVSEIEALLNAPAPHLVNLYPLSPERCLALDSEHQLWLGTITQDNIHWMKTNSPL